MGFWKDLLDPFNMDNEPPFFGGGMSNRYTMTAKDLENFAVAVSSKAAINLIDTLIESIIKGATVAEVLTELRAQREWYHNRCKGNKYYT